MFVKMEPIQVSNPLRELLSLPKAIHDNYDTFPNQAVFLGLSGSKGASDGKNKALDLLVLQLTEDDNPGLKLGALQALEELSAVRDDLEIKAKIVHCTGALSGLLVLLADDNNPEFQVRSAKIIRHLADGNFETKATIVNHPGAMRGIADSFSKETNPSLRQNTVWALSLLATSNEDIKSKIAQGFVLEGLMPLLEDGTDPGLQSKAVSAWQNLAAGGGEIKSRMVRRVRQHDRMKLRWQWMLEEIPPEGAFEGLGTFLKGIQDVEEFQIGREENEGNISGGMEDGKLWVKGRQGDDDKQRDRGKQEDDCLGCWSFCCLFNRPRPAGLWPSWIFTKGNGVAFPQSKPNVGGNDVSVGERPLEVLLMSLSKDLEGKDLRQQQKVLRDLCARTQATLDAHTASYTAQHPEGLMELISLYASPSLRGLVGLALKNLAANHEEIRVTTVRLLISLTVYTNPLQDRAVWGLGSLATNHAGIKAEIVNKHEALMSLVAILNLDDNYSLRTTAAITLRNLASGDITIKAKISKFPGAIDSLVRSLTAGLNNLPGDCNDKQTMDIAITKFPGFSMVPIVRRNRDGAAVARLAISTEDGRWIPLTVNVPNEEVETSIIARPIPQNAALTLGNLAGGDGHTKARIIDHPGALEGLARALMTGEDPILQQNAAFALGNLAGGDGLTKAKITCHPTILGGLALALWKDEYPILQHNAALALSNLADGDEQTRAKILNNPGAMEALVVSLAKNANPSLQKYAARALGLLATGDSETKSKIVNHPGVLEGLVLSSLNLDNVGMRLDLKLVSRNLAANDDVETMAKTKICHELWNIFCSPGALAANSTSPMPWRSYICKRRLDEGTRPEGEEQVDYKEFGYTSEPYSQDYSLTTSTEPHTWISECLHDESHLDMLLESLPKNMDALQNGPILQRQAIRDLCDVVATRHFYHSPLILRKIVNYPRVLDGLATVLSEDSNPHLQVMAGTAMRILASECSMDVSAKIVDHLAFQDLLVTPLTNDKNPLLQEETLETLGKLTSRRKFAAKLGTHSGALTAIVTILTKQNHPKRQTKAYDLLTSVASDNDETKVRILDHLTSQLLKPGNSISFQYLASSIAFHLARTGGVATASQIVRFHPWVVESLVALFQSGHQFCYFKSSYLGKTPRVLPALHNLACGDNETRAKLANYPGVIAMLVSAIGQGKYPDMQDTAACALSELARSDDETKAKIVEHPEALAGLIMQLSSDDRRLRKTSALTLRLLAGGKVQTRAKIVDHPGFLAGLVMSLGKDESPVLQQHAAGALLVLADGDCGTKAKIIDQSGALERLVKCLADDGNPELQETSAFALRNLALAEEHRQRLRETDHLVERLQDLLAKEARSLVKREQGVQLLVKKAPSSLKWAAAACALTLLDPLRGNETHLHTADAFCGRGRANMSLRLFCEALEDLNKADQLQQQQDLNEVLNLELARSIWRYRSTVKTELGDTHGALEDADKARESS